jgi:hypothetical protein
LDPAAINQIVQIVASTPMAGATLLGFWLISRAIERVLREKADAAIRAVVGLTVALRKLADGAADAAASAADLADRTPLPDQRRGGGGRQTTASRNTVPKKANPG